MILKTDMCGIEFKNPVVAASGPAGNGQEFINHYDISKLGGFTAKTVTFNPAEGNPPPRIVDVHGGIINSIGLQNKGINHFLENDVPFLKSLSTVIICSIASNYADETEKMTAMVEREFFPVLELNFSCPNVDKGKEPIGDNPVKLFEAVSRCRKVTEKPLFVKFGPVSNLEEMVKASVDAGADGVTLINCAKGVRIDINTGKPILKRVSGGLAGPAIKPIAVYNVYHIRSKFPDLNIIGTGGIMNGEDALEFIMAGANLVGVGFGLMVDPEICDKINSFMADFLSKKGKTVDEVRSSAHQ